MKSKRFIYAGIFSLLLHALPLVFLLNFPAKDLKVGYVSFPVVLGGSAPTSHALRKKAEPESKGTDGPDLEPASTVSNNSGPASNYLSQIRAQIQTHLKYPYSLKRRRIQGALQMELEISEKGELLYAVISSSSGNAELDTLAIAAAHEGAPFLKPLDSDSRGSLKLKLPIEFKLE